MSHESLRLDVEGPVAWLRLNRPQRANAIDLALWTALPQALEEIGRQAAVRVVVLAGEGRHFCGGADLSLLASLAGAGRADGCQAEARDRLRGEILRLQRAFSALEALPVPVIAAVHGACIGAGVDLIAACDLRYATADARFCIKEVDLGIAADVGTLQRLGHVVGLPVLAELAYTAETIGGERARELRLVNGIYATQEALYEGVAALAQRIAAKPALAVRGIKHNLLYAREHSVADALEHIAVWNASALQSADCERLLAEAGGRGR